jgi:VIT1/CCC1 family predicted Fe2+/Mn2+ transporter
MGRVGLNALDTEVSRLVDGLARIIVAITGGVFLLVPMIIMTFATDAHMRLVVVSVAMLWFAVSVPLVSKATNQELIAATAAYSAVLVVYVGTTSGASGH